MVETANYCGVIFDNQRYHLSGFQTEVSKLIFGKPGDEPISKEKLI
jgi:hypothetical protein